MSRFKVLLFTSFLMTSFAFAENSDSNANRGRLADGRAFRTDSEGAQLVDYIAELELNVEELKRRVVSLEDENQSARSEIDRIKAGRPEGLLEKNLIGASPPQPQFPTQAKFQSPESGASNPSVEASQSQCPVCPAAENSVDSCSTELTALRHELEQQKSQASEQAERAKQVSSEVERNNSMRAAVEKQIRTQVFALERELVKTRAERDRLLTTIQKTNLSEQAARLGDEGGMRASMASDLDSSRIRAVEMIRAQLRQDLSAILSKKDERDLLFAKYVKERQGVSLKPSSLRARSGRELRQLDSLIKDASTVRELALMRVDLEEIRHQMADDLALVERMSKLATQPQ